MHNETPKGDCTKPEDKISTYMVILVKRSTQACAHVRALVHTRTLEKLSFSAGFDISYFLPHCVLCLAVAELLVNTSTPGSTMMKHVGTKCAATVEQW